MAFTDENIIQAIVDGKETPDPYIAHLYRDNRAPVMDYVMRNQGQRGDALEVLHLGILKAFEAIQSGKYQKKGTLNRYILTICRNLWISRHRKANKVIRLAEGEADSIPDDSDDGFTILVKEDQLRICRNLLGRMGEKCRKILLWAEGEGRPMKWIAQSLGYSGPQVAMNKKSSCKKKLMDLVRKHPEYTTLIHEIIRN